MIRNIVEYTSRCVLSSDDFIFLTINDFTYILFSSIISFNTSALPKRFQFYLHNHFCDAVQNTLGPFKATAVNAERQP